MKVDFLYSCTVAAIMGEESPGSSKERCQITSGGRNPRESATENIPPKGKGEMAR